MVYVFCSESDGMVLSFGFKGHQGSGNIHKELKRGKDLALVARELIDSLVLKKDICGDCYEED